MIRKILGAAGIAFIALACAAGTWLFAPHGAHLGRPAACAYRYQYFDDAGAVGSDAVRLSEADAARVRAIVNRQRFGYMFDYVTGVSDDHCLEFTDARGITRRIYLVYGSGRNLRMDEWNLECVLSVEDHDELFGILEQYERFDLVLIAG